MTSVFTMATTLNQSNVTMTSPVTSPCLSESYDMWTCYGGRLVLVPLIMVVGVPGNILVLLVYSWRFPASTFREFVRVLALVDLTSNLVAAPLELLRALSNPGSTPAPFVAPAIRYASFATHSASALVLLVIAVDRYLKVCQPQKTGITIVRARLLCVLGILTAFLVNILACFFNYNTAETDVIAIVHPALVGFFFLAFTVSLATLYSLVWHRLRSHARRMSKSSSGGEAVSAVESAHRQALRTSKVFSAVTVLFFLSILPYFLSIAAILVDPTLKENMTPVGLVFIDLANVSPHINTVANPFVYSFTSPSFRKELWDMLQGLRSGARLSRRPTPVTASSSDPAPPRVPGSSRETSEEWVDSPM